VSPHTIPMPAKIHQHAISSFGEISSPRLPGALWSKMRSALFSLLSATVMQL
jgi:hypothetical protein